MHRCPNTDTMVRPRRDVSGGSVPSRPRRGGLERLRALVTEEVVAGEDVVDLQAFRAGVALADVALKHVGVVDDAVAAPVYEPGLGHGSPTRLTAARWLHRGFPTADGGVRRRNTIA